MQQAPLPGDEHLAERLAKARAVPAEERDRETAAFIESEQLEAEARAALPLPKGGGRAPPPSGPTAAVDRRRILTAYLKCARGDYLCPGPPPSRLATSRHLMAHLDGLWPFKMEVQAGSTSASSAASSVAGSSSSGGGAKGGRRARQQQKQAPPAASEAVEDARSAPGGPLARVLQLYFAAPALMPRPEAFEAVQDAAAILADPVCAPLVEEVLGELEALAALGSAPAPDGQPAPPALLSAAQLRWLCCYHVAAAASSLLALQQGGYRGSARCGRQAALPEAQRRGMLEAARAAAKQLAALEPASPLSWITAGDVGGATDPDTLAHYTKALELARVQRRPFYVARAGDMCLTAAVGYAAGLGAGAGSQPPEAVATALGAHREAREALRQCRPLLPQAWVSPVLASLENSGPLVDLLSQQLAQGGTVDVPAVLRALQSAAAGLPAPDAATRCCHCGAAAAQLKRCARCKSSEAQYCSVDCQRAAWPAHKKACSPA